MLNTGSDAGPVAASGGAAGGPGLAAGAQVPVGPSPPGGQPRKAAAPGPLASVPEAVTPLVPIVPDRLYWVSVSSVPAAAASPHEAVWFTVDEELAYDRFFADFGPLNLGKVFRYCEKVTAFLKAPAHASKVIYHYTSTHKHKQVNSALLAATYAVLCQGRTAEDAFLPFMNIQPPLVPFRDASFGLCTFMLSMLDCLRGIAKARDFGWCTIGTFDIAAYEKYEKLENGDMNWLVPGKFLAFSGPLDQPKQLPDGRHTWTPADYVPVFKQLNITAVIRLNKAMYDRNVFVRAGIHHYDLFFPDGSTPPPAILQRFIEIAESERGGIAVHCKAGLGRTGTCIGAFVMKHYRMTGREIIGWFRICRPGCIIGPQQHFMETIQPKLWREGESMTAAVGTGLNAIKQRREESKSAGTYAPPGMDGHLTSLPVVGAKSGGVVFSAAGSGVPPPGGSPTRRTDNTRLAAIGGRG